MNMSKKWYIVLIMSVIFTGSIFCLTSDYVVLINSTDSFNLPVLHSFDDKIIVIADESTLTVLNLKGYDYQILTTYPAALFLITGREAAGIEIYDHPGLLYTHYYENEPPLYLIKDEPESIYQKKKLSITPLNDISRYDDEIKKYLKYSQDVLSDPIIDDLISSLDTDKIAEYIIRLQDYGTRYFLHPNRREIVDWLQDKFLSFGFQEVVIDSFFIEEYKWGIFPPSWQYTLEATLPGSTYPENYLMIGAHYDSIIFNRYGDPMEVAPGADDNASGVASLLEIARVMAENNYRPKKSIRFLPFAAEEIGLYGSRYLAEKYEENDYNIEIMLNNDMIANKQEDEDWKVKIYPYSQFRYIGGLTENIFKDYTTLEPVISPANNPASDSYSFWQHGFPTVFFHEYDFSEVYHSPNDIIDYCDIDYAAEIIKASLLTIAYFDRIPSPVENIVIVDRGCGTEVVIDLEHNNPSDVAFYKTVVNYITEDGLSGELGTVTSETGRFSVSGLTEGTTYYFAVAAINRPGFESVVIQQSFTPQSIPHTVQNFSITPFKDEVVLTWDKNSELDIAGYNIYRSNNPENVTTVYINKYTETSFIDTALERNRYYYYSVTAVDKDNNESIPTEPIRTGLVSLDRGILIINATPGIDETDSSYMLPSSKELFHFYDRLLAQYKTTWLQIGSGYELDISCLGFYSTTLLFNDSINRIDFDFNLVFGEYLERGGNLLLSGFDPLLFFQDANGSSEANNQSIVERHLGIKSSLMGIGSRFSYAESLSDSYPTLCLDTAKSPAQAQSYLINIAAFNPLNDAQVLFRYGSQFPPDQPSGAMQGQAVGVLTEQTLTLSFPLYYIEEGAVKIFLDYLLQDLFSEQPIDRYQDFSTPPVYLFPNYPNPFNIKTTIPYYIKEAGKVEITVYNIKGQFIRSIYSGYSPAGRHKLSWDGKDTDGADLPTGIYITSIRYKDQDYQRKLLILK